MKACSVIFMLLGAVSAASNIPGSSGDDDKNSLWSKTSWRFNDDVTEYILREGASPDYILGDRSILMRAVYDHDIAVARVLLSRNANVNLPDRFGGTPLMLACAQKNLEMVNLLLSNNADVHVQDNFGRTALWHTVNNGGGDLEILEALLAAGAQVNVPDYRGMLPLNVAVNGGLERMTRVLFASGAKVNAVNHNGQTALHLKVLEGGEFDGEPWFEESRASMIRLLIGAGADPSKKDLTGRSPIDLAVEIGRHELADLMISLCKEPGNAD